MSNPLPLHPHGPFPLRRVSGLAGGPLQSPIHPAASPRPIIVVRQSAHTAISLQLGTEPFRRRTSANWVSHARIWGRLYLIFDLGLAKCADGLLCGDDSSRSKTDGTLFPPIVSPSPGRACHEGRDLSPVPLVQASSTSSLAAVEFVIPSSRHPCPRLVQLILISTGIDGWKRRKYLTTIYTD